MMSFVGAARDDAADGLIAAMERGAGGPMRGTRGVGPSGVQGNPRVRARRLRDGGRRSQAAAARRPSLRRAHAQRDGLALTLIEAALRGGQARLARALAAERTNLKPTSPFNRELTERARALLRERGDAA
jgi:hypothetical protein